MAVDNLDWDLDPEDAEDGPHSSLRPSNSWLPLPQAQMLDSMGHSRASTMHGSSQTSPRTLPTKALPSPAPSDSGIALTAAPLQQPHPRAPTTQASPRRSTSSDLHLSKLVNSISFGKGGLLKHARSVGDGTSTTPPVRNRTSANPPASLSRGQAATPPWSPTTITSKRERALAYAQSIAQRRPGLPTSRRSSGGGPSSSTALSPSASVSGSMAVVATNPVSMSTTDLGERSSSPASLPGTVAAARDALLRSLSPRSRPICSPPGKDSATNPASGVTRTSTQTLRGVTASIAPAAAAAAATAASNILTTGRVPAGGSAGGEAGRDGSRAKGMFPPAYIPHLRLSDRVMTRCTSREVGGVDGHVLLETPELTPKHRNLQAQLAIKDTTVKNLHSQLARAVTQLARTQLTSMCQSDLAAVVEELQAQVHAQIVQLRIQEEQLAIQSDELQAKDQLLSVKDEEIQKLQQELIETVRELTGLQDDVLGLRDAHRSAEAWAQSREMALRAERLHVIALQEQLTDNIGEVAMAGREKESSELKLVSLSTDLKASTGRVSALRAELDMRDEERSQATAQLEALQQRLDTACDANRQLQDELQLERLRVREMDAQQRVHVQQLSRLQIAIWKQDMLLSEVKGQEGGEGDARALADTSAHTTDRNWQPDSGDGQPLSNHHRRSRSDGVMNNVTAQQPSSSERQSSSLNAPTTVTMSVLASHDHTPMTNSIATYPATTSTTPHQPPPSQAVPRFITTIPAAAAAPRCLSRVSTSVDVRHAVERLSSFGSGAKRRASYGIPSSSPSEFNRKVDVITGGIMGASSGMGGMTLSGPDTQSRMCVRQSTDGVMGSTRGESLLITRQSGEVEATGQGVVRDQLQVAELQALLRATQRQVTDTAASLQAQVDASRKQALQAKAAQLAAQQAQEQLTAELTSTHAELKVAQVEVQRLTDLMHSIHGHDVAQGVAGREGCVLEGGGVDTDKELGLHQELEVKQIQELEQSLAAVQAQAQQNVQLMTQQLVAAQQEAADALAAADQQLHDLHQRLEAAKASAAAERTAMQQQLVELQEQLQAAQVSGAAQKTSAEQQLKDLRDELLSAQQAIAEQRATFDMQAQTLARELVETKHVVASAASTTQVAVARAQAVGLTEAQTVRQLLNDSQQDVMALEATVAALRSQLSKEAEQAHCVAEHLVACLSPLAYSSTHRVLRRWALGSPAAVNLRFASRAPSTLMGLAACIAAASHGAVHAPAACQMIQKSSLSDEHLDMRAELHRSRTNSGSTRAKLASSAESSSNESTEGNDDQLKLESKSGSGCTTVPLYDVVPSRHEVTVGHVNMTSVSNAGAQALPTTCVLAAAIRLPLWRHECHVVMRMELVLAVGAFVTALLLRLLPGCISMHRAVGSK